MNRLLFFLLLLPALALGYPLTPDRTLTPGELCTEDDEDFVEYRYPEEIPYCERDVSSAEKDRIYDVYRIPEAERKNYTVDHLIPLSLGGSNGFRNLWPEHKEVKALRPQLENVLYRGMRDGEITQKAAVSVIVFLKRNPVPDGN